MRQPVLSLCALALSFALGVATTLQVQSLRESFLASDAALPALTLPSVAYEFPVYCRAPIVTLDKRGRLGLNGAARGTLDDTAPLIESLSAFLREREAGRDDCPTVTLRVPPDPAIYVRAPRTLPYGDLTLVLDAVERAGAKSIKLSLEEDAEEF
jgi:biopolymer transport protein ExbD